MKLIRDAPTWGRPFLRKKPLIYAVFSGQKLMNGDVARMLKPKEKKLAELMCCEPSLRNIDYAHRCGISEKSVYVYKAKPEFQEYLSQLCKERFRSMEALAIKKLKEEIDDNNFKAIQYLLDGLGYKAKEQQEIQMDAKIEVDYGES